PQGAVGGPAPETPSRWENPHAAPGSSPGRLRRGTPGKPTLEHVLAAESAGRSLFCPSKLCAWQECARTLLDTWRKQAGSPHFVRTADEGRRCFLRPERRERRAVGDAPQLGSEATEGEPESDGHS